MKNKRDRKTIGSDTDMPLSIKNYHLMLIGLGLIVIGFLLLMGGGSDDPNIFNDAMFSVRRLIIAPLILLAGFVFEIYAIMKRFSNKKTDGNNQSNK